MQSVFALYFSFEFWSQSYDPVLLKMLLKASINEFNIWLCSADPNSFFPFSGFCSQWCTPYALKVHLFYALSVVFGADLGTKWAVYTRWPRVCEVRDGVESSSNSSLAWVSYLGRSHRSPHDMSGTSPLSSLNSSRLAQNRGNIKELRVTT